MLHTPMLAAIALVITAPGLAVAAGAGGGKPANGWNTPSASGGVVSPNAVQPSWTLSCKHFGTQGIVLRNDGEIAAPAGTRVKFEAPKTQYIPAYNGAYRLGADLAPGNEVSINMPQGPPGQGGVQNLVNGINQALHDWGPCALTVLGPPSANPGHLNTSAWSSP
jgi:hypothetical protein